MSNTFDFNSTADAILKKAAQAWPSIEFMLHVNPISPSYTITANDGTSMAKIAFTDLQVALLGGSLAIEKFIKDAVMHLVQQLINKPSNGVVGPTEEAESDVIPTTKAKAYKSMDELYRAELGMAPSAAEVEANEKAWKEASTSSTNLASVLNIIKKVYGHGGTEKKIEQITSYLDAVKIEKGSN